MNAIIFHGSSPHSTVQSFWYQNVANELNMLNIETVIPQLPRLDQDPLSETLGQIKKMNLTINEDTILIGHSAGTNIIFSVLEDLATPVKAVFLVAGYCTPNGMQHTTLRENYDWQTIKSHAQDFYMLNSFNDPFNCNEKQGKLLFDKLGGTLILKNEGHFIKKEQPLLMALLKQYT